MAIDRSDNTEKKKPPFTREGFIKAMKEGRESFIHNALNYVLEEYYSNHDFTGATVEDIIAIREVHDTNYKDVGLELFNNTSDEDVLKKMKEQSLTPAASPDQELRIYNDSKNILEAFNIDDALAAIKNGTYKDYFTHHDLLNLSEADIRELKSHASQHDKAFAKSTVFYKDEDSKFVERDWEDVRNALMHYQKEDLETLRNKTETRAQELDVNPAFINAVGDDQIKEWLQELQALDNNNPAAKLLKSQEVFNKIAEYINKMPLGPDRKDFKTQEEYIVARDAFREAHKDKAYREPAPENVYKAGTEGTPPRKVYDINFGESENGKLQGTMYIPRDDGKQDIITFDKDGKPTAFLRADPKKGTALSEKTLGYLLEKSRGIEEGVGRNADSKSLAASAALGASRDAEAQSPDPTGNDVGGPGWGGAAGGGAAVDKGKDGAKVDGTEPVGTELDEAKPMAAETTGLRAGVVGHDKALEKILAAARGKSSFDEGAATVVNALHEEPDPTRTSSLAANIEKGPEAAMDVAGEQSAKPPSAVERDGAEADSILKDALGSGKSEVPDSDAAYRKSYAAEVQGQKTEADANIAQIAGAAAPDTDREKALVAETQKAAGLAQPTAADTPPEVQDAASIVREEDHEAEIGHSASRPMSITTPSDLNSAVRAYQHLSVIDGTLDPKMEGDLSPAARVAAGETRATLEEQAKAAAAAQAPAKGLGKEQGVAKPAQQGAIPAQPAAPAKDGVNGVPGQRAQSPTGDKGYKTPNSSKPLKQEVQYKRT